MTEIQQIARAKDAAQVLENLAYKDAMKALRDSIYQKWRDCPIRDQDGQRLLLQMVKLADTFEDVLNGYVANGQIAQHKIDIDKARNESPARRILRSVVNG